MALFKSPQEHAANPPSTWQVVKVATGSWSLRTRDGAELDRQSTKKAAEALKVTGFYVTLYDKEGRWYKGEAIPNWRPYVPAEPVGEGQAVFKALQDGIKQYYGQ